MYVEHLRKSKSFKLLSDYVHVQKMVIVACTNKSAHDALDKLPPPPDTMTSHLDHGTHDEDVANWERRRKALVKYVLQVK